jgi:putative flippase GtrA
MRFLVAGGINTGATYLIYLAVLFVASYRIAYTVAFAAGIVIAYLLNSWSVFKVPLSWKKLLQYPVVYVVQYVAGLILLTVLVDAFGMDKRIAPLVNVVVLIPLTFVLSRYILAHPQT